MGIRAEELHRSLRELVPGRDVNHRAEAIDAIVDESNKKERRATLRSISLRVPLLSHFQGIIVSH